MWYVWTKLCRITVRKTAKTENKKEWVKLNVERVKQIFNNHHTLKICQPTSMQTISVHKRQRNLIRIGCVKIIDIQVTNLIRGITPLWLSSKECTWAVKGFLCSRTLGNIPMLIASAYWELPSGQCTRQTGWITSSCQIQIKILYKCVTNIMYQIPWKRISKLLPLWGSTNYKQKLQCEDKGL